MLISKTKLKQNRKTKASINGEFCNVSNKKSLIFSEKTMYLLSSLLKTKNSILITTDKISLIFFRNCLK